MPFLSADLLGGRCYVTIFYCTISVLAQRLGRSLVNQTPPVWRQYIKMEGKKRACLRDYPGRVSTTRSGSPPTMIIICLVYVYSTLHTHAYVPLVE